MARLFGSRAAIFWGGPPKKRLVFLELVPQPTKDKSMLVGVTTCIPLTMGLCGQQRDQPAPPPQLVCSISTMSKIPKILRTVTQNVVFDLGTGRHFRLGLGHAPLPPSGCLISSVVAAVLGAERIATRSNLGRNGGRRTEENPKGSTEEMTNRLDVKQPREKKTKKHRIQTDISAPQLGAVFLSRIVKQLPGCPLKCLKAAIFHASRASFQWCCVYR